MPGLPAHVPPRRPGGGLTCAPGAAAEPVPHALAAAFLAGVCEAAGLADGPTVTVLDPGHRLLAGPKRKRCPACAHTFRPNEAVVVCPCRPAAPVCDWAVHRDPGRGLLCWDALLEAKTRCPVRGGEPQTYG